MDKSLTHANHVHVCICHRTFRGNAYYRHRLACPVWWQLIREKTKHDLEQEVADEVI